MGMRRKDIELRMLECLPVGGCLISHKQPSKRYPASKGGRLNRLVLSWKLGRSLRTGELATHTCGVSRCLNPDHIVRGTTTSNNRDTVQHGHHVNLSAKLSPKDRVRWAKEYLKGYTSQMEISIQAGVSQVAISAYVRRLRANPKWDGRFYE